jgi:hypothetical protein
MILAKRIGRLEKLAAPIRENRIVLRYEGPGSEHCPQPTKEDIDSGVPIVTVQFVEAKDGHPA